MNLSQIAFSLTLIGCSPYLSNAGQALTIGSIRAITSEESQTKLTATETKLIDTARDEALSPATQVKVQALVDALAVDLRTQLTATRDVLLNEAKLTHEVATLRETLLGADTSAELRELVRSAVDEALGTKTQSDVDTLIDSASPHLDALVARLIDSATPRIQTAIQSTSNMAEKDLASLKVYLIWTVTGLGLLLLVVVVIIVGLVLINAKHNRLSTLVKEKG